MTTDKIIDEVVKEVLIRMGKIAPLKLLKNAEYDENLLQKLQDRYGFRVLSQEQMWSSDQPMLVPRLTNKQLMSVYNGMPIDLLTSCVQQGLLMGAEILVFESTVELLQTPLPDTPYVNRFKEAYEVLKASGLRVIEDEICEALPAEQIKNTSVITAQPKVTSRILDRKTASEIIQSDTLTIHIPQNTIITPLAQDLIREANVTVERLTV